MTVKELKEILDKVDDNYEVIYYDIITGAYNITIDIDDEQETIFIEMYRG